MFRAIGSGNADEVMRLLDADPTLLEKKDILAGPVTVCEWLTPLMYAAQRGQLGIVKLLIGRGAHLHATSSRCDRMALHYAAEEGHEEVVAYLIHSGTQPGRKDENGLTPLMEASKKGHARVVVLLLERMGGQGLETKTLCGRTALLDAISGGHEEVLAHLLRHGARADTMDIFGDSALSNAVRAGHVGVVKLLIDHLGPQALHERDEGGLGLLDVAVDGRHEDMVVFLLGKGLGPDTADDQGVTPVMRGARRDSIKVLRRLLGHVSFCALNDRDASKGKTALHWAAPSRRPENLRALLLAGADPDVVDNEGSTPRLIAQAKGHDESVAAFNWWKGELERGALLYRVRVLHDTYTMHQHAPTRPVPGYLEARTEAGLDLPRVEVVAGQQEGTAGKGKGEGAVQQERHAMVEWVVRELNGELFTELMQGFHAPRN